MDRLAFHVLISMFKMLHWRLDCPIWLQPLMVDGPKASQRSIITYEIHSCIDQVKTHREVRFWFGLSYDAAKLHGQMLRIKFCYPSKNYWQFSSTILIKFSCNNKWDFQKCPCNSHLQLSSNSHLQFSSNSHLQFSSNSHLTILIQFSPDNSHPILTWQFSSNSHLQFSLNSHQHCSVNSHQQCSANFLVMISQSVLISHAAIFIQCWFYNKSE